MLYYSLLQYTSTSEIIDGVISVLNVLKSAFEQNTRSLFISDLFIQPDAIMNESYAYPNKLLGKEIEEKPKGNEF
jgi:hypothetical protein